MKSFLYVSCLCTVASLSAVINFNEAIAESKGQAEEESAFVPLDSVESTAIACGAESQKVGVVGVAEDYFDYTVENRDGKYTGMSFSSEAECKKFVQNEPERREVCLLALNGALTEDIKERFKSKLSSYAMTDCVSKRLQKQLGELQNIGCDKDLKIEGKKCIEPLERTDVRHGPCIPYTVLTGCGYDEGDRPTIQSQVDGTQGGGTCLTSPDGHSFLSSLGCVYKIEVLSYGSAQKKCGDCKR